LKRPLTQTITCRIAEAGFVVKIIFYDGIEISGRFEKGYLNGTRKKAFSAWTCLAFNSPMPQERVSFKTCQRQAEMALLVVSD
jgi:hypothetical protein